MIDYIDKKIKQARWVQKCISNRTDTLFNVAKAIVKHQYRFFRDGSQYMNVLRMSDIAEELEVHESTIIRAVKNKYIGCVYGTFPLKYFFVQGIPTAVSCGDTVSSHEIKKIIQELINNEDKFSPLSDNDIALILERQATPISRRTVAKYREQLQIPKSYYRHGTSR